MIIATDFFNSPLLILDQGQPDHLAFTPYGHSTQSRTSTGFKGELRDESSGQYLLGNGYRAYNPVIMRFNSPDSMSPFSEGGFHTYTLGSNDPVNGHDPTGHSFVTMLDKVFGSLERSLERLQRKKTYSGPIVWKSDGILAFEGPQRADGKLPTLYIDAHGKPGFIRGEERFIQNGQGDAYRAYTASDLYNSLVGGGIDMRNRQTHILACQSSVPNFERGNSFAGEMASLTKAQSSGYEGAITLSEHINGNDFIAHMIRASILDDNISVKTRQGRIRNPHKLRKTGPGGRHW